MVQTTLVLLVITAFASANVVFAETRANYCTRHLRTGTKKTIVRFYDSRNASNEIDQKQAEIFREVQSFFGDFETIAFVETDVSICAEFRLFDDFPDKQLPNYGVMNDGTLLALCNAPDTFKKMWNFFFDFVGKAYKRQKGFKTYTSDLCNITYPTMKGEAIFNVDHDQKVAAGKSFVLYFAPLCRYCKEFLGYWNEAYNLFHHEINFYYIDCVSANGFCAQRKAFGWPTIYYYGPKDLKEEYTGNENINEISDFLTRVSQRQLPAQ